MSSLVNSRTVVSSSAWTGSVSSDFAVATLLYVPAADADATTWKVFEAPPAKLGMVGHVISLPTAVPPSLALTNVRPPFGDDGSRSVTTTSSIAVLLGLVILTS